MPLDEVTAAMNALPYPEEGGAEFGADPAVLSLPAPPPLYPLPLHFSISSRCARRPRTIR